MTAPDPRPKVVRDLLVAKLDPAAPHVDATPAERTVAEVMHGQVVEHLRDQGVIPRERTFLDVTLFELEVAAAVYGVLRRYVRVHGHRPLSDILKIADAHEVELVSTLLQVLGYPPAEEGAPGG